MVRPLPNPGKWTDSPRRAHAHLHVRKPNLAALAAGWSRSDGPMRPHCVLAWCRHRTCQSSASEQVANLVAAGFLSARRQGRHKDVALAGPEIARVVETMMTSCLGTPMPVSADPGLAAIGLRRAPKGGEGLPSLPSAGRCAWRCARAQLLGGRAVEFGGLTQHPAHAPSQHEDHQANDQRRKDEQHQDRRPRSKSVRRAARPRDPQGVRDKDCHQLEGATPIRRTSPASSRSLTIRNQAPTTPPTNQSVTRSSSFSIDETFGTLQSTNCRNPVRL
jgi:hypothetical protein